MWLVNELVLTFSAPIKCTKAQFNLIILSRVMPHTTYRQTDRQIDRQTDRQAGRQTGRQADRQTGRQADRQTDRQTDG